MTHVDSSNRDPSAASPDTATTIVQVAVIWILADLGYYLLLPQMGVQANYNAGSVAIALYYVFWIGIAVITFWPVYVEWGRHGKWHVFSNRAVSYFVWSVAFTASVLFAGYVLPLLPPVEWSESWTPPEVRVATSWYFLPKSIDILFQQLLIVAFVVSLAGRGLSMRRITLVCALTFGAAHLLLYFGPTPIGYVIRFMIAATAFGALFPYLILRVPNGLAYSYIVHWFYYALTVAMPHITSGIGVYLLTPPPGR